MLSFEEMFSKVQIDAGQGKLVVSPDRVDEAIIFFVKQIPTVTNVRVSENWIDDDYTIYFTWTVG
jgi:hypothetical protein